MSGSIAACLERAHQDGHSSIMFPGNPCSIDTLDADRIVKCFFDEIALFIDKHFTTSVKKIYIQFPPEAPNDREATQQNRQCDIIKVCKPKHKPHT